MKISSRKSKKDNLKLFASGILTIFVWKGIWTAVDNYLGLTNEVNIILLLISLIVIYFINGKIELY